MLTTLRFKKSAKKFYWLLLVCSFCMKVMGKDYTWDNYKKDFIQSDGRVIDKQQNITHSEAQGYALILSVMHNDPDSFANIWTWSKNNLQIRDDKLFAWSWGKSQDSEWKVLDKNNATDGDVLIAFALLLADKNWNKPIYKAEAKSIIINIRQKLTVNIEERHFLLPGTYGFNHKNKIKLNPSYQIIRAYEAFTQVDKPNYWKAIIKDAKWLIAQSFHPIFSLPSDWVCIDKSDLSTIELSNQFGYEAIRIYLYQLWESNPEFNFPAFHFDRAKNKQPIYAVVNFTNINKRYNYEALAGYFYLYAILAAKNNDNNLKQVFAQKYVDKVRQENQYYYSRSLQLLSQVKL